MSDVKGSTQSDNDNSDIVILDVGGKIFKTTVSVLSQTDYFKNIIINKNIDKIERGETIFINDSPHIFKHILELLRCHNYPFPLEYKYKLDYYQIDASRIKKNKTHKLLKQINDKSDTCLKLMKAFMEHKNIEICEYNDCYEVDDIDGNLCNQHRKYCRKCKKVMDIDRKISLCEHCDSYSYNW